MEGLIEFLESASGPIEGSKAWDVADRFNAWGSSSVERELFVSALQGSIDAALALAERVLDDEEWMVTKSREGGTTSFHAILKPEIFSQASTPALAICAAILRASAADGAGHD